MLSRTLVMGVGRLPRNKEYWLLEAQSAYARMR